MVDLRSGTYAKLAPNLKSDSILELKVMTRVNGVLKSVTHFNKATKGDILRASLKSSAKAPQSAPEAESYFRKLGFDSQLTQTKSGQFELIVVTG